VANALERWEEEGGAPTLPWPFSYETGDLLDAERRVLECLSAALYRSSVSVTRRGIERTRLRGRGGSVVR
jgi:hypothetical protein